MVPRITVVPPNKMTVLKSWYNNVNGNLLKEKRAMHWGGDLVNMSLIEKSAGISLLPRLKTSRDEVYVCNSTGLSYLLPASSGDFCIEPNNSYLS